MLRNADRKTYFYKFETKHPHVIIILTVDNQKHSFINTWQSVFRISLYVAAVAIILYCIPKDGKFKYEYQKGSPWRHENLIAPFDFAIYKTESELDKEKLAVTVDMKRYFIKNNEIQLLNTERFLSDFNNILQQTTGLIDTTHSRNVNGKNIYTDYRNTIYTSLKHVYNNGIIQNEQLVTVNKKTGLPVYIRSENITSQVPGSDIYTPKTAYVYVKDQLQSFLNSKAGRMSESEFHNISKISQSLNFNLWIECNLTYDEELSAKVLKETLESISLTHGMILAGQRIIYKGEIVGEEEFRVLESLRKDYEQTDLGSGTLYTFAGQSVIIILLFSLIYLFLKTFRREIFYQTKYSALILCMLTCVIAGISMVIKHYLMSIYLVPFLLLPIIIKTFFDTRTGLFFHIIACVATGFIAPNSFEYFIMQFIPGYFLLISFEQINRRGLIFSSAIICFVLYTAVYLSFEFMHCGVMSEINLHNIIYLAINSLLLLLAYPAIYAFEKLFGLISDVSLVELADSNRPLLRRLAQETPGTFQHCMQVANLAEAAIFKIGGNPHLARTGALYHDIGKLAAPMYYTENQVHGINPHDDLDRIKSAEIIINHVIKGVEIAKKYKLPKQLINFIKTHHGTTKVMYFYKMYCKEHPDEEVNIEKFTYPGPRPFSKEGAVVMMADCIEAASRSLKQYDVQTISDLVENIVNSQIADRQFDNTKLTFKDIDEVKELFKEKIANIYHARIEYPK